MKLPRVPSLYRTANIPKGGGKFRQIIIPSPNYKEQLKLALPELEAILAACDTSRSNYAFVSGSNCAEMALQHVGMRYTLTMDLENFFDSINLGHLKKLVPANLLDLCLIDGCPKQGLPTSPVLSGIAFSTYDRKILSALKKYQISAIYTRYADDLVFSFNDKSSAGKIETLVRQVVESGGFKVNERKTRLQDSRNGRRIITGIAVDHRGLHPSRKTKRKIRAAEHQGNQSSQLGLMEWAKCKLPGLLS